MVVLELKTQIFGISKKNFSSFNSKFDKNGRKFISDVSWIQKHLPEDHILLYFHNPAGPAYIIFQFILVSIGVIQCWHCQRWCQLVSSVSTTTKLDTLDITILLVYYYSKVNFKRSLDTNDFDISFAKGLSLENGTTTITDLTWVVWDYKLINNLSPT